MLSFKSFLLEGIIKIEENILNQCVAYFVEDFFDEYGDFMNFYDKSEYKDKELDKHIEDVLKWADNQNIPEYFRYKSERYNVYANFKFIIVSWDKKRGAAFKRKNQYESAHTIYINKGAGNFVYFINQWLFEKKESYLKLAIGVIKDSVEHELSHLVDFELKEIKDKKKLKTKNKYESDQDSYFTSPVEFEQQTVDVIRFIETMVKYAGEKLTKKQFDEYVWRVLGNNPRSIELPKLLENNIKNSFILSLKKIAPEKYKKATIKIYSELDKNIIPKLKKEGLLEE